MYSHGQTINELLDPEDGVDELIAPSVRNADAFLPSASQIHPLTFAKNLPNQFGILKTSLDAHKVISARYKAIAV